MVTCVNIAVRQKAVLGFSHNVTCSEGRLFFLVGAAEKPDDVETLFQIYLTFMKFYISGLCSTYIFGNASQSIFTILFSTAVQWHCSLAPFV